MRIFFFWITLAFSASAGSEVENAWSKLGKSARLECKYKQEVDYCLWSTPYQPVMAFNEDEQIIEDGRIKSILSKEPETCTLYINEVQEKDKGLWTCFGNDNPEEIMREHKKLNLDFVTKPLMVSLQNPFEDMDNETAMESKQDLRCTVENSMTTPEFNWYIEDTLLEGFEENTTTQEGTTWIQTLTYQPMKEHSNKSLKCVVKQPHTDEKDINEATILFTFTDEDIETVVKKPIAVLEIVNSDLTTIIIVIMVGVFGTCLAIYILYTQKCLCFKQDLTEVDAEASFNAKPKESDETETEKADSTKEEKESTQELTEAVKKSFGDRFASFFRMNKSSMDEKTEEPNLDKPDNDIPEVVIDNKEAEEKNEEETKNNEETDEDQTEEMTVVPSKFRNFFVKLFKPRRDTVVDKQSEEPVKMTDCEKDELEPEDKPEVIESKSVEVESENQSKLTEPKEEKEPTILNTSFN